MTAPSSQPRALMRSLTRALPRELSGAVADLGVMLPYAIGFIVAGLAAPGMLFAGFGLGYLVAALVYRAPVPIQPMKALGAIALAGGLSALELSLSGVIIGVCLLALGASGGIRRVARWTPQSVSAGLQLGLGGMLALYALSLMESAPWTGAALTVLLLALGRIRGVPAALLLVVVAAGVHWRFGAPGPIAASSASAFDWSATDAGALGGALFGGVLPQLPLTLMNAVLITAALARELTPERAPRITETRLCWTSGALNLLLCPFGAAPMCHGAGGLAAHHRFGARGGLGVGLLGALLLTAAIAPDETVLWLASLVPRAALGALLLIGAGELAYSRRLIDATPSCKAVIGATAIATVLGDPLLGVGVGLAGEAARQAILRRRPRSRRPKRTP